MGDADETRWEESAPGGGQRAGFTKPAFQREGALVPARKSLVTVVP
jgi:hypothetical protein